MALPSPLPDELVDLIAGQFRLLAEPTRVRLFDQLRDGEAAVHDLAEELGTSQQNVSKHLALLAEAGVVARRKAGNSVYYRIADDDLIDLCDRVERLGRAPPSWVGAAAGRYRPDEPREEYPMRHNMKTFDRLLRTLLVAPAAVVIGILIGPGSAGAVVLYVVAAIMLATSAVGYCPLYSLLHLDSHNQTRLAR